MEFMKKMIKLMAFVMLGLFMIANVQKGTATVQMSDFLLENVEALSSGEDVVNGTPCKVIGYKDIYQDGCWYNCAWCAEGYYVVISVRDCYAK
jgi:hypothetical protein